MLLARCHTYRLLTTTAPPPPGTYVAAVLNPVGDTALGSALGPDPAVVRGRVLHDGPEGMTLSVQSVALRRGDELVWRGESVTLPPAAIARVERRRLAAGRSFLLLVVGATAFVTLTRTFDLHVRGTGGVLMPNGPGPPTR